MPLENKQIEAMAAWTLEDFQDDPLAAIEQVRELAAEYNRRNPFEPGQNIFVVERDENGDPYDAAGYMYIGSAAGCIIVSPYINDIERLDLTMAELAEETAEDYSCSLSVFPEDDCFGTLEEAQQMIQDGAETEEAD